MDQEKIKQLETEITSSFTSLRNLLSQAQATTGAMDVFLYQLKKEMMEPDAVKPEEPTPQ